MSAWCRVYWGSHGCNLPADHGGQHMCGCCDPEDPEHMENHRTSTQMEYGADHCAGTWPYYGRKYMMPNKEGDIPLPFFRPTAAGTFEDMPDEFDRLQALTEERR